MTLKTLNIKRRNTGAAFNASNPHNRPWREWWMIRSASIGGRVSAGIV